MPFCPQCRFEYEPNVAVCPECGVPLVAELPPEEGTAQEGEPFEWQELVTVFNTLEYGDAALVESLLQGSDIPAVLTNEKVGLAVYAPLALGGFQIQVPREYAEQALAILQESEHLAEQAEAPAAPTADEMGLPAMDDDGEV